MWSGIEVLLWSTEVMNDDNNKRAIMVVDEELRVCFDIDLALKLIVTRRVDTWPFTYLYPTYNPSYAGKTFFDYPNHPELEPTSTHAPIPRSFLPPCLLLPLDSADHTRTPCFWFKKKPLTSTSIVQKRKSIIRYCVMPAPRLGWFVRRWRVERLEFQMKHG
jgi:hypothetical protein